MALIRYSEELETQNKSVEELNFRERVDRDEEKEGNIVAGGVRGENGTDYFRPTGRPKAYGRQKQILSDSCRIRSRIQLVFNGYGKGYGFTKIRPYPKIYHISRLYPDNIRQNIRQ
jgi:hypothetical protein